MNISQEELNERVAVLKRFRALLEEQRGKFQEYLTVLEKQQDSIESQNPEAIMAHTKLEEQVVSNITNLQKVIVPMTKMYNSVKAISANRGGQNFGEKSAGDVNPDEIDRIQNELFDLQSKVLMQNQLNHELLRVNLNQIKNQMQNFKNPYRNARSVYAQKQPVATMVEINI